MYDLKDDKYMGYLEGLLLADLDIPFYNLKIKQLKVKEVLLMGEDNLHKLVMPFTINVDLIDNEAIRNNGFKTLDVISMMNNDYLDNAIKLIKLICGLNDNEISIMASPRVEIMISNDKGLMSINADKFEELKGIVLKMFNTREINDKDIKDNKDNNKLERIMKIEDRREREYQLAIYNNKNKTDTKQIKQTKLYNVYNFMSNCYEMDYSTPLNTTVYQIFNSYNIKHMKDNVEYTMRIASSGMCSGEGMDLSPLSTRIIK